MAGRSPIGVSPVISTPGGFGGAGALEGELRRLGSLLDTELFERQRLEQRLDERLAALERRVLPPPPKVRELREAASSSRRALLSRDRESEDDLGSEAGGGYSEEEDEEEEDEDERPPPPPPTGQELDQGEGRPLDPSLWDAAIFVGLPGLGPVRSVVVGALIALTTFAQLYFCHCVSKFMLSDPVTDEVLDSLLQFRTSTAHDIRYADRTNMRSLIASICSGEHQLQIPFAGAQVATFDDLDSQAQGGMRLCTLSLFCWFMTITGELDKIARLAQSLLQIVGEHTVLVKSGYGDDASIQLRSIGRPRILYYSICVMVPRIVIVFSLLIVGSQYLLLTTSVADMLLNAMALSFILDIDELVFAIFGPRRLQRLVARLDPLPAPPQILIRRLGGGPMVKFVLVVLLLAIAVPRLFELHERIAQAKDILCSGERDFVFAVNPVTSLVEVAETAHDDAARLGTLNPQQLAILQIAQPTLKRLPAWTLNDSYFAVAASPARTAQVQLGVKDLRHHVDEFMATGMVSLWNLSKHTPDARALSLLNRLASSSMAAASGSSLCRDTPTVTAWSQALFRRIGLGSCDEAGPRCADLNASAVRGLCARTCQCSFPGMPRAGFFASARFGCPKACSISLRATALGLHDERPCIDIAPEAWASEPNLVSYAEGLVEFFTSSVVGLQSLGQVLKDHSGTFGIPPGLAVEVMKRILNGTFVEDVTRSRWQLAPGIPHPRQLVGCAFWASWEMTLLLGVDLCGIGGFRSIRGVCASSCGCMNGVSGDECPLACGKHGLAPISAQELDPL